MGRIKRIIYHWSDSGPLTTVRDIRYWHMHGNGWRDIGYNWVILHPDSPDVIQGTTEWGQLVKKGRPINNDPFLDDLEVGAHTKGLNSTSVGVCVVASPGMKLHPLQREAIINTAKFWPKTHQIPPTEIYGHKDFNPTQCPGVEISNLLHAIKTGRL